jgi:hypothetical protein
MKKIILIFFLITSVYMYSQEEKYDDKTEETNSPINPLVRKSDYKNYIYTHDSIKTMRFITKKKFSLQEFTELSERIYQIKARSNETKKIITREYDYSDNFDIISLTDFKKIHSPINPLVSMRDYKKYIYDHDKKSIESPNFFILDFTEISERKYRIIALINMTEKRFTKIYDCSDNDIMSFSDFEKYEIRRRLKSKESQKQEFKEKLKQIPATLEQPIPFRMVEDLPVFPGCKGRKAELKSCFSKMVGEHVSAKFNFNLLNELGLDAGRKKVLIAFKINNKGNVVNIKVKKVPHPEIEKEVVRVMKMLPTMKPGRQRGRAIGVSYNFPLIFIVEEKSKKNN